MKTFEECLNEVASIIGFANWDELTEYGDEIQTKQPIAWYKLAAEMYAHECCQASLNKASENAKPLFRPNIYGEFDQDGIDDESITDPSNIVIV